MAYKRKTYDVWNLVYDYGYGDGPEIITSELSRREALQRVKEYRKNEGIFPTIKCSRELIKL